MDRTDGNIRIRGTTAADAARLCAWWNDGSVMAHAGFPNGLGTTEEKIRAQIAVESDDTVRRHIIEYEGAPIGETVYKNRGDGVCEIGIKICEAEFQNRGLGKRVLSLFIRTLFDDYGCRKIVLDTNLANARAQHVYERLGFRKIRVNVDSWKDQLGRLQSSVDYELTRERFVSFLQAEAETDWDSYPKWHFDLDESSANALLKLVLEGKKRATSSSLRGYELEGERPPQIGDKSVITDWDGNPACLIRTNRVQTIPYCEIPFELARLEGEDDSLESWRRNHDAFFSAESAECGYRFTEDMPVVFEEFEVLKIHPDFINGMKRACGK